MGKRCVTPDRCTLQHNGMPKRLALFNQRGRRAAIS
jgi:hypothetical protein